MVDAEEAYREQQLFFKTHVMTTQLIPELYWKTTQH